MFTSVDNFLSVSIFYGGILCRGKNRLKKELFLGLVDHPIMKHRETFETKKEPNE